MFCAMVGLYFGLTLASATPAKAYFYFHYYLTHPQCCGGDPLLGTRATIRTPSSAISLPTDECILFRSDAEGLNPSQTDVRLIQVGFVRCGNDQSLDGTCATVNNQVRYIEIVNSTGFHCYPKGVVGNSVNDVYTVKKDAGSNTWRAFISAVADPHTVDMLTLQIVEGGEYTGGCGDSVNVPAVTYGVTQAWQRHTGANWFTVQSSYTTGTVCGYVPSGGPTGQWTITK
jgi:hypothetical protein